MNEFVVTEFRPCHKGDSLQGFLTLRLPSGMILHHVALHEREDGARWIGLPTRQYTKQDGSASWVRLIDFATKDAAQRFQKLAKQAIDGYFASRAATGQRKAAH